MEAAISLSSQQQTIRVSTMRICPHVPSLKKIEGGANFLKFF